MSRMFCYVWSEKSNPNECKFGERWVKDDSLSFDEVWDKEILNGRIKESLGVRKDLLKDGNIILNNIWDVSDYSKSVNRFKKGARVDDELRTFVGFRKYTVGEVHSLPPDELIIKINTHLSKHGQPLPKLSLSQWQFNAILDINKNIKLGKNVFVLELAPRFGKTLATLALSNENNIDLTIIATYVLTSFTSFKKDVTSYEQFKDYVVIDLKDNNYKKDINLALKNKQKVICFLSMCGGGKRQERIDFVFSKKTKRMLIVDEGDFGVHRENQARPLINAKKKDDIVILMTGTDADKAANLWKPDYYMGVTYPELVLYKKSKYKTTSARLKNFLVSNKRDSLIVEPEYYYMNLGNLVDYVRKTEPDIFVEDGIYLPSWTKYATDPIKAKGFFTRMLESLFLGQNGFDELNVDYQFTGVKDRVNVRMLWLPGSIKNLNLDTVRTHVKQVLPNYEVVCLYGDETTNAKSENLVKQTIEIAKKNNKDVLVLSARMGMRSFSVGEIDELYLAYDGGSISSTIQKISRVFTPHTLGKIGRIISLSFDPNRDDKFDNLLLTTSHNFQKNQNIQSLKVALSTVLSTLDIFRCLPEGRAKLNVDDYLPTLLSRNSISKVIGRLADFSLLSQEDISALANGNSDYFRSDKQDVVEHGKTRLNNKKNKSNKKHDKTINKDVLKAREVIITIAENMDIILYQSPSKDLTEAFKVIDTKPELQLGITQEFGVSYETIKYLITAEIINRSFIDLMYTEQKKTR